MIRPPKSVTFGLLSIAAFTLAGSPVLAQMMATPADSAFLMKASQANMAEVAAGKMAQKQGSTLSVRMLGAKLAADHAANEHKVMMLAKKLHVAVPMHPTDADKDAMMMTKSMTGASFDADYVKMEEQGHMKNIAAFKSEAAMTKNPMIAAYIKATLPTLETHLQMAETHNSKMHMSKMNSGSMGSGSMKSGSMGSGSMNSGSMGSSAMHSGAMGSGAAGSQNSGKSSSSGGQVGSPSSGNAGSGLSTGSGSASGNSSMNTPPASPAAGSSKTNSGPNGSGLSSGTSSSSGSGSMNTPPASPAAGSSKTNTVPNGSGLSSGSMNTPAPK